MGLTFFLWANRMCIHNRFGLGIGEMTGKENKVVPYIEGDGVGVEITSSMRKVVDAALARAYVGSRTIEWLEVLAGQKARHEFGRFLPTETLDAFRTHRVGIKGPLTTPVGEGIRSLNVAIRQTLDLYSCIRPIKWWGGFSLLPQPSKVDVVIFRENTEGLYSGVEFEAESPEAEHLIELLQRLGVGKDKLPPDSGLGIKIASEFRTKRHVRRAFRYALEHGRKKLTVVHKGNIMRATEGAFWRWSQEVAAEPEFSRFFMCDTGMVSASESAMLMLDDRIADNMFQQISTRLAEFDVVITTNLNGDYLSEAAAALVGGIGMAPSCNMGDEMAVFEATHGTVPKYAGQDKANPSSLILSGALMLSFLGWTEAAEMIENSLRATLANKMGTSDLVLGWKMAGENGFQELSCSEFTAAIVDNIHCHEAAC